MPKIVNIVSSWEYDFLIEEGAEPLLGYDLFRDEIYNIKHELRRELQDEKFKTKEQFYKEAYRLSNKCCEETGVVIPHYSAVNISHILSRGSNPAMWNDLRNFNLLSFQSHQQWETGKKKEMKIWAKNEILMQELNREYYGQRRG